jgi:cysteine desulfurase
VTNLKPIYLDNAASTSVKSGVLAKFNEVAKSLYANPSSMHKAGLMAKQIIWESQDIIAEKLGCESDEIFFTSGATMSNNIFIQGMLRKHPETMFVTSTVEHNDIMELYDWLPYSKQMIGVSESGRIILPELYDKLSSCAVHKKPYLVSIQMANSETGVIQPIKNISNIVHNLGGYLHVDATQYVPYYPINMKEMGIDALSMSGQKIGGLKGSGVLVVRQIIQEEITPIIFGEQGLVGGTPATPLIASLGEAFSEINYNIVSLRQKRDWLLSKLEGMGGILVGTDIDRLPNNIYIRFPGINGLRLMNILNEYDIYIGTGSACSTDSDRPSHVALAYGLTEKEAFECVRFTLGNTTTDKELKYVVKTLDSVLRLLR